MKKYLKHLLFALLFFSYTSYIYAQEPCPPGSPADAECSNGGSENGNGTGTRKVPINDYTPILIITAITIAGLISYKQRELLRK